MRQQDAHVLDGRDQVILNLLSPESPPARALKVMIVGRIGKALFHQLLAAFAAPPRRATVCLRPCYIEGGLFFMSLERAPELRSGALRSQQTSSADSAARLILHGVAHRMQPPRP